MKEAGHLMLSDRCRPWMSPAPGVALGVMLALGVKGGEGDDRKGQQHFSGRR